MFLYKMKRFISLNIIFGCLLINTDAQCTWPAPFVGTSWTDTEKGELMFGDTTMTGWTFEVDGQVRNEWKCVKSDTFDDDGYLLMVTTESFVQFVTTHYYAYLCLKTKKVTDISYRYYIEAPIQTNVDHERILVFPYDTLTAVKSVCYPSFGASGSEYKLLVKTGSEMSASITCPYNFLGVYDYTHTSSDGTQTCSGGNSLWDMCSDNTMMSFNLGQCPTKVAYSGSPSVLCIDTVPIDNNNYVTVYNYQDATVDSTTTYKFSCFAISADGSTASVAPKYCRQGQTPDSVPVSNAGQSVGATMSISTTYTTCPTCPVPLSPDGGSVYVQTDGAVTTAHYVCAEDYSLYGAEIRTCLSDNTWEFDMPACKCNEPTPPANGEVIVSADGVVATYNCLEGYTLNGNNERFCQDDGKAWNGTDPTCDICDTLADPVGGSVTVSIDGPTSKASYQCNVSYTLVGVKERLCLNGGSWDSTEPSCVPCAPLSRPELGTTSLTTDGFTSTATFACTTGYQLSDSKPLVCGTDGTWDTTEPECVCESLSPPINGDITMSADGKTATYTCTAGFTVNGDSVRVCLMDGTAWNGTAPTCAKCPDLAELTAGNVTISVSGSQTVATFTCKNGYTLSGSAMSSCLIDGTWDADMPTCVSCDSLTDLNSGSVNITTNGTVSRATYECSSGYYLVGESSSSCLVDGSWGSAAPKCYCDIPTAPPNGAVTLSDDKLTLNYQCDTGYTISGSSQRMCLSDGTGWTGTQPTCESCQTLPNVVGGSVELVSTGTITQGNFSCVIQYTMNGVSLLSCRSDGSWDLSPPSCVLCDLPSTPASGSYSQETNGKVTTTTFSCADGYGLSGSPTSNCRSDGTWDSSTPNCVECPAMVDPASGTVSVSSNGSHSLAVFSCVSGYHILGATELNCGDSGTWSDNPPACICDDPPPPLRGAVTSNGSLAVYTCDTGYAVSDSSMMRNCADDGTGWNGVEPSCVTCDAVSSPQNGSVNLTAVGPTTVAVFSCSVGYTVSGSPTSTCQSDGSWDTPPSLCSLCNQLTDPDSGSFTLETNRTVTTAVVSCISGYEVFGSLVITCNSDGSWNSVEPTCVCETPSIPPNGSVSLSEDRLTATYSCDAGFTLDGTTMRNCQPAGLSWSDSTPSCVKCTVEATTPGINSTFLSNGTVSAVQFSCAENYTMSGSPTAECQTDGQLDQPAPTCVSCATLSPPSSGSVVISTNGTTSSATYSCAEGYHSVGEVTRTCGQDGLWDGSNVICICEPPLFPPNGNVSVSIDGLTATYECDTGYILAGKSERNCADDGMGWSDNEPSCTTCESISTPARGSLELTSDGSKTSAVFTCDAGTSLLGDPILTCLEDGTWDLSAPTCVSCPDITDPDSGQVQISTDGSKSTAVFSCSFGYYLSEQSTLTCELTGNWSDNVPSCVCNPPSDLDNGQVTLLDSGHRVEYACDLDFSLDGVGERQCGTDGSGWSDSDPVCVPCPALEIPEGGSYTSSTDGLTTTAKFDCDSGYSMKGSPYLACLVTGAWNDSTPTCVYCPSLSTPSSGSLIVSTAGTVTIATYSCQSGYKLVGSSERVCSDTGVWESSDPTCVCIPPLTPTNGQIIISGDGMTVDYTCKSGYSLEGVSTRHCQTDGTGWDESSPACNFCMVLDNINGGFVTITTAGVQTQAIYSCDSGYSMNGGSVLTCRSDGTWDVAPPVCTSCEPLAVPISGDVTISTDGQTNMATFSCLSGYTLQGQSNITCKGDGTWNFMTPSCERCATLTSPDSGTYTLSTDGSVTTATFSCVSNYHSVGSGQLTCDTTGNWDSSEPLCVCDSPAPPSHGSVESDGLLANYTCDNGYTLNGVSVRGCGNDGIGWDRTAPTCNKCDSLGSLKNGDISLETDGVTTVSIFSCGSGYTMNGRNKGTCGETGTWDTDKPECVECQSLSDLVSGSVSIQTNGTVTVAEFSCITGYEVFGTSILTCDENGLWDTVEPTCVCKEPEIPMNGSVAFSEDRLSVTFSCDVGFSLSGTTVQTCQPEGPNWTDTPPACVECMSPTQTNGLNLNLSTDGTVTEIAFTCNAGFTLIGSQHSTCRSDGSWEIVAPSCVMCPSLVTPSSGTLDISTNGTVSTAVYTCAGGYSLVGDSVRTCQETGQWTGQDVKCFCNIPDMPVNGNLTLSEAGQTVTYTCEIGYKLIGDRTRHCGSDGTGWTGNDPNCTTCESLTAPSGGSMDLSTDGLVTIASFTCHVGYTLLGAAVLTCQSDSAWDWLEPLCVQCPALSDPDSGYVSVDSDGLTSTAMFTCDSGYEIVGAKILSCLTNGLWNYSSPICVCEPPVIPDYGQYVLSDEGFTVKYTCESGYTLNGVSERRCGTNSTGWSGSDPNCVSCPTLTAPSSGNISLTTDGVTTTTLFSCDVGFSLSGATTLTCLDTGSWNDTTPACKPCLSLAQPDSGSIELFSDGINTFARYDCVSGYYIAAEGKRTCLENGNWTYQDPRCVCRTPDSPVDGNITVSDDGMIIQYACDVGFTLQGVETRHCQSGGAGWDESSPSCTACETLQNLAGGTVTQTTDGTTTEAIFSCETGYTMTGTPVLACRSDGTWNMSQPLCTSCQPQQVPTGGDIQLSTDGSTTFARFSCQTGYTLQGVGNISCRSDGSWDYVTPNCVQCATLNNPASGTFTVSTDGTTSTAVFSCSSGYHLEGAETLSCDTSGVWTDIEPFCKCNALQAPENGSVEINADGMSSTYSCSTGYTLVGATTRVCGTDGSGWSGTDSTCVKCQDISSVDNGAVKLSTDGVATIAVFTCDSGSTINGSATAECGTDGSWTVTVPQCAVCPNVSAPSNGSLDHQTDGGVTVAKFTCDKGFSMSGEDSLYCGSDGVWHAEESVCVECLVLESLPSGKTVLINNGTTTTASFTCDSGYYLEGLTELNCLSDGTWDNVLPSCVCKRPSPPENGSVWISADGMTAVYNCELGFTLDGQGNSTCGQDGSGWSSTPPVCVECQALGTTDNGRYEIKSDSLVTMATVTCDEGYSLNGSFEINCQTSGFWDIPVTPSCVKCQDLSGINSGTVSVSTSGVTSVAAYTCLSGYYLLGSSTRYCDEEGNWSDTEPICVCNAPLSPLNGNVSIADDYLTATANCDTGYSLAGDKQRTCQQDGTGWNGIEPTCSICATLSSPAGGTVNMQSDGTTTFAEYLCNLGYSMEGKDMLQCRSDGSWDITSPSCTLCETLSTPNNGEILYRTNGINTIVTIECETGHTLKGADVMTCLSDGGWNDSLPTCVVCPSLSAPDSGEVELLTDGLTSIAVFSCASGYTLQGQTTLTCGDDGVWSDNEPKCFCIPPLPLANGTVIMSANESVVTYSCEPGFSLDGNSVRVCQPDGSGWDGSEPICTECEPVAVPDNGSLSIQTDGVGSVAVFRCELGFSLSGEPTAKCQADGFWNSSSSTCVKCVEVTGPENGSAVIETDGIQTTARYSCDLGYSVPDSHLQPVACQSDGSWESQGPVCSKCADIPEVYNGAVFLSSNGTMTVATFECLPEYYLNGEDKTTCQGDGTWNYAEPACLCNTPPAPLNGNVSSDGMITTYFCEQGYSMKGTLTQDCSQDGSGWSGEPPTCVKCESLPATTEAYTTSANGVQTVINFTCPSGKSLKGNATLTCSSEGVWDSDVPSCVECEALSNISSGGIILTTDTTVTYAAYSCVAGYYLMGQSVRTCQDTSLWDGAEPKCVCNPPEPPMHGNQTISEAETSVVFSCEPGYSINGQSSLTCLEDGSGWNGEVPSCTICQTLPTPVGAFVEVTFEDTVSVAKYSCDNGFSVSGASVLSCRSDGTWNISAPTCVSCPNVNSPGQGNVESLTDGLVTTVYFTCNLGYALDGSAQSVCKSDGSWDSPVPVCVDCPTIAAPSSGAIVQWSSGIQTGANISCASGYYLEGEPQLVCDGSGTWDADLPNCYCEEPNAPGYGSFDLAVDKMAAQFSCLTGYTLRGAEILTCQSDGSGWDIAPPVCETCELLDSVENGTAVLSSNGTTTVSTFSCQLGSSLNGSSITECGNDGKWNVPTPVCVPCENLTAPSSGSYEQFTNGSFTSATFTCTFGYDLVGYMDLSCRSDGTWDHSVPQCVCSAPYQIDNGNYSISNDGMSVVYACHTSYTLVGEDTRHCGTDGSWWQGTTPNCVACQSPPAIDIGSFLEQTNGTTSSAVYRCPLGYSLNGSQELKCKDDGSWDVAAPVCVSCAQLDSIASGNHTTLIDGSTTQVQYSCHSGYDIIGNSTAHCQTDGSWDFPPPLCYCQEPAAPLYGQVSSNGTEAVYTCGSGYSLSGVMRRTCGEDGGGWSDNPPTCVTCEVLPIPTGGSVNFTTDGQYTSATIDCEVGYTLDGVKSLLCSSDGTWNTQPPTCGVPCSTLSRPANATVALESDGTTTRAVFECKLGSTLKGESTVTCRADGTWDFTEPSCASCPLLSEPPSGEMSITTDGLTTIAEFSCADGYHLVGQSLLECLDDGVWNSSTPVCECNLPAVPQSGSYEISEDGSDISFSCDTGFTLKGLSQITCMKDGSGFNASAPECVQCEEFSALSGGSQNFETDGITSAVTLSCDTGYSLKGPVEVVCNDNGTWEISDTPECVLCPALTSVQNGLVTISTDGRVSSTTFHCDVGYSIKGATTTMCQTDGTWDSEVPTCVSCPELSPPDGGYIATSTNGTVTTASFSCMFGYYLEGQPSLQCLEDGKWDAEEPICVCNLPYQPSNGEILVSENGYRISYSCNVGYSLLGVPARQCQTNGTGWDGQDPSCVTCPSAISITNGNFVTSSDGVVTTVNYKCSNGYSMKGEQLLECTQDGFWNSVAPDCVPCPAIQSPDSGTVNETTNGTNTIVSYTCAEGYVLKGISERTCLDDGSWTDSDPVCECGTPATPSDGDVTSDGQTAVYSCGEGFTMQGTSKRYCGTEGAGWNSTAPTCTPCHTLDASSNTIPSFSTDGSATTVTFSCGVGYILTGASSSICRSDGSWNFAAPTCVACETLSPLDNGSVNMTTDGTITQARYTCESGFSLKGFSVLTCRNDGAWDFSAPICVACAAVYIPHSSNVLLSTDGTSTFATYSCAPDYYMSGPEMTVCLPSGEWESNNTQCICIPPTKPDFGNLELSNNGTRVLYTCETGFSINGTAERQCLENGRGWDGSDPQCVTCDVLNDISGGNLTLVTSGTQTSVSVECDVGLSVNGSAFVTCGQDGSWENSIPICVACPTLTTPANGNLAISTNGTTTYAYYNCSLNYTLNGQQNIACGSDGQWETETPQCVKCDTDTMSIDSGTFHLSTNGSVSKSEFSCVENYYVYGDPTLHCMTDGTWDSDVPTCVCDHPGSLENGNVLISRDKMEALYSCHTGYSLVGTETRDCQHGGLGWTLLAPVCVVCLSVVVPENGSVLQESNGTVTMAAFSCDIGFSLKGQTILSCLQNESWDLVMPTCITCLELTAPDSGYINFSSDGQHTTASYQCADGYHLDGVSERVCDENGDWNSLTPICKCNTPANPVHGSVSVSENSSVASYSCDVGYSISGTVERLCQTDGQGWSEAQPVCVLCGTLTTLSGGNIELTTDGHMSLAKFTCNSGYSMDGPDTIGCREDGTWNSTGPTCSECSALETPAGAVVDILTDGVSTAAMYTCAEGYTLVGSSHVTCKSTGNWDLLPPSCVRCPDLQTPSSGSLSVVTDGLVSRAVFQCASDYYIFGSSNLTCQFDGSWSSIEPECRCNLPPLPVHASMNVSEDSLRVRYTCETGYTLNGSTEQLCLTDGSGWDIQAPSCSKCEDLVVPANGSIVLATNGVETIATILCDVGGSADGIQELTCSDQGVWDYPAPSCIVCPVVTGPDNGTVALSTNGSVTVAVFTCDSGHSLTGSPQLTCKTDELWDNTEPVCAYCPLLTRPVNGDLVRSSNGTHSMAEFSCTTGYEVLGEPVITCLYDGSWSAAEPLCVCEIPSAISNGEIMISSDRTLATYSCHSGFTMNTEPHRLCLEDGSGWSGDEPACMKCDELANPIGGNVEISTDSQQTFANITCPSGYTVSGNSELTCRSDGTWDVAVPSCSICDTIDKPDHGQIIFDSDGKTTKATMECEVGYTLSGSSVFECRADGSWDFNIPACVKCPDLVSPENGNVSLSSNAILTTALFSCINGYKVLGQSTLTCDESGSWDAQEPFCVCEVPVNPANGSFNLSADHMTLTYNCLNGFTLQGNKARYCDVTGSGWDGSDPDCVECHELDDPEGSVSDMFTDGMVSYKTFTCASGSTLNGSAVVTCGEDGSWSQNVPNCAVCPLVLPPKAGSVAISTDSLTSVASFTCYTGYRIVGDNTSTCQSSGIWSSQSPRCVCDELPEPQNGVIWLSDDQMSVTYLCDDSFTLKGNQTRFCDETGGGWDGLIPTCVQCESQDLTLGMSRQYTSDGIYSIVEFTCDTGYTLQGTYSLKCDETGVWSSDTLPECVSCSEPVAPASGSVAMATNGTSTKAYFSCSTGYHVSGNSEIECTKDGVWSASVPICHCDQPLNISDGYVSSDGVTATYFCLTGYTLNGEENRHCLSDGSGWDGVSPTCVACLSVNPPVNGSIITSTNGTVTKSSFGCDVGFTLKGSDVISCQNDGLWEESFPVCISCPELDIISSGTVSLQTNGQTTMAMFTCTDGYQIFGSSVLTCMDDGQWDSTGPSCVCEVPELHNSELVLSEDRLSIKFSCDVGFSLKGPSERSCLPDGSGWDLTEPECVHCDELTYQTGNITFTTDGLESTAVFSCEPGLSLKGSPSLSCNTSGSWVGELPECVSCPALNQASSGSLEITSNGTVSLAAYSCHLGYTLVGDSERVCSTAGTWTATQPACVCEIPPFVENGNYELSNNDTIATYSCDRGYSLRGSAVRVCQEDGTGWNTEAPTCVKCPTFQTFSNGNINMSVVDGRTEAMFTCDTGCTLSGQSTLTCLSDGTWDFQTPDCACCPPVSAVASGNISIVSDGITTTALFICANGYNLIGEDLLTCRSNGLWDIEQPHCSCIPPNDPWRGKVAVSAEGSVANYSCGFGYSLSGLSERTCLPDGTGWEGEEPTCLKCTDIQSPENGTRVLTTDGLKTFATLTCVQGYSLTGESWLTCEEDGNWNQVAPSCVKCPALTATSGLRYNSSSDGMVTTASFECIAGFELVGQTALTCLRNGSWDAEQPTCLEITVTTTPFVCEPTECSSGATVGVAVVLSLIIVGLIIALAILGRLYRRLRKSAGKSQMYTDEGKTSGDPFTKQPGVESDLTKLSLSTFDDIEIFSKATAPVSHRRHVLDMGRTQSSLAPSGHQKHLLELAGHTSSPAPLSYLTPSRSSTLAQFAMQNKRVRRLSDANSPSPSPKPYEASMLTPTPRTGLRGTTPSPVPSTEGQEYDSNLPQQILTPREVPIVDRASPKPTPTTEKKTGGQAKYREGSSSPPKAPKRKKQSKKLQESGSFTPRSSQSSPFKMKLTGIQHTDAEA